MIKMKYPYDSKNAAYDGKEHDIEPKCLVNYKGTIYLLYYRDMTLEKNMHTFLLKNNLDDFYNVPLDSYDSNEAKKIIKNLLYKMTIEKNAVADAQNLPNKIGCLSCHTIDDIINNKIKINFDNNKTKTEFATLIFHNLADDKHYCDPECTMFIDDVSALGVRSLRNRDIIIDEIGKVYNIVDVYVNNNKPMVLTPIFHNLIDDKYYCDPECTMLIDDVSILGTMNEKNHVIINGDIVYNILDVNTKNQSKQK